MKQAAKVVTPYSAVKAQTLGCCGFFFPCTETGLATDGYITDTVSGIQYQPSLDGAGGQIANVTGLTAAVELNGTSTSCPLKSGSWPNFGTKSVIVIAVGRVTDSVNVRVPVGKGSAPVDDVISVSWVGGMHVLVGDGVTQSSVGPDAARVLPANGTDVMIVIEYTPATTLTAKATDLNGTTFGSGLTETILSGTPSASIGDLNPGGNNQSRADGLALYGWAAFSFTNGLPADRDTAYKWMAAEWASRGNRYLWPGWIGTT